MKHKFKTMMLAAAITASTTITIVPDAQAGFRSSGFRMSSPSRSYSVTKQRSNTYRSNTNKVGKSNTNTTKQKYSKSNPPTRSQAMLPSSSPSSFGMYMLGGLVAGSAAYMLFNNTSDNMESTYDPTEVSYLCSRSALDHLMPQMKVCPNEMCVIDLLDTGCVERTNNVGRKLTDQIYLTE